MLLLKKLNISLMTFLGIEKPIYAFEPKLLGQEEKVAKIDPKKENKENKEGKEIFDEEAFKKAFDDDRIASRFAMIGFCKDFFEKEGELERLIGFYQNDKNKSVKNECESLLQKIE